MNSLGEEEEEKYREELDLALAISLSEAESVSNQSSNITGGGKANPNEQRPPTPNHDTSHSEPSSLIDSLSDRFSRLFNWHTKVEAEDLKGICSICHRSLSNHKYLIINDKSYHSECYRCSACNEPLKDRVVFSGTPSRPYHPACAQILVYDRNPLRICEGCHQAIKVGVFITSGSHCYHQDCFRCAACHQLLLNQVRFEADLPYHPDCAKELFNPHCCLCSQAIEGTYSRHPFFSSEIYCLTHSSSSNESLKTCFSCGRKEPLPVSHREGFIDLSDGRALCPICSSTMIIDSSEAAVLYQQIIAFFETQLQLPVPPAMRTVPVLAVDLQAMNENRVSSTTIGSHGGSNSNTSITRGLTLSSVGTIRHFNRGFLSSHNPIQEIFRIEEVRDVTAVLVLYGLPHDLFAAILAHEATHVWLKLNKSMPYDLPPEVEEGLCQLIAHKYLEYITTKESNQRKDKKEESESKYFLYQIETDRSLVYGEGFRAAKNIESQLGLEILLEFVARNKSFPII